MGRPAERVTVLVLLLVAGAAGAAGFVDASLEYAVRAELGNPEGVLRSDQLVSLSQLSARGAGIRRLDGIEQLTGLAALDLASNRIVDLTPIAGLTGLQLLDLEDNQVEDLTPLRGLTQLRFLVINRNRIVDIEPLLGLSALANVELQVNPLSAVALAHDVPALRSRGAEVRVDAPGAGGEELPGEGAAPEASWEHLGPEDETLHALSVWGFDRSELDPQSMVAGTDMGLWRSTDGGRNWAAAGLLPEDLGDGLAIDPVDPLKVYFHGVFSGISYRSVDGGQSWEAIHLPSPLIQVDPLRSGCLYAAQAGGEGLWLSLDDGTSWELLAAVPSRWDWSFVFAHPADHRVRYLGIVGRPGGGNFAIRPLLRSDDDGQTWREIGVGQSLSGIAPDPLDTGSLYGVGQGSLWHSTDAGHTWRFVRAAPVGDATDIAVHPADPDWWFVWTRFHGGYESHDGGAHWDRTFSGVDAVYPDPTDARQALVQGSRDRPAPGKLAAPILLRTRDGGAAWSPVDLRSRQLAVRALAFATDGILYGITSRTLKTGTFPFLITSETGGRDWWVRDEQVAPGFTGILDRLHVDPVNRRLLFAFNDRDFLRSTDGGGTWAPTLDEAREHGLGTPDLAVRADGRTYYAVVPTSLYRSLDAGRSWAHVLDEVRCMALGPGAHVYVGRPEDDRVWRSPDGGDTWEVAGTVAAGLEVVGLAWQARANRLLAVAEGGVYVSADGGAGWVFLAPVPATQWSRTRLVFHPRDAAALCLLVSRSLLGSVDGGRNWTSLTAGSDLPGVQDVAVDPTDPGRLYAATSRGVYRRRWPAPVTAVVEAQGSRPRCFGLDPSYPNPFNGTTTIPYHLFQAAAVRLTIYDVTGQRVRDVVREAQAPGSHRAVWDGTDAAGHGVASGVYLCRLRAGVQTETRRLALLR